ncbi:DUF1573 domain-containing protein [Sphingobacterium multivorum]|uniref:DUF1573 domain-containing protein n=1 Tax=Sphingobacterium multivorum TaxID=28454 RepID=UPI0031BAFFB9
MESPSLLKKHSRILGSTYLIMIFLSIISCKSNADIKFLAEDLQIGNIKIGESKEIITQLTNIGNDTLLIENVSAGCHCTNVIINRKKVSPGEKADINLTLKAGKDMKDNDKINVPIVIRSNTKNKFDEFYISGTARM